jgi:hypothetical protein
MNAGFEAMDSGSGGTISANFQFAFKATFKSSTYHKHRRVWDKMVHMHPEILMFAVRCERNPGGEWSPLVTKYGKTAAKN